MKYTFYPCKKNSWMRQEHISALTQYMKRLGIRAEINLLAPVSIDHSYISRSKQDKLTGFISGMLAMADD